MPHPSAPSSALRAIQTLEDNAGTFDFDTAPGADLAAAADFAAAPSLAAAAATTNRATEALVKPAQDTAFDPGEDIDGAPGLDMRKIMIQRSADGGLDLHIVTDGLMGEDTSAEFIFAIDIDNNAQTGSGLGKLLGDDNVISGVEWIGAVRIDRAPRACSGFEPRLRVATAAKIGRLDRSIGRGGTLFAEAPSFREVRHPSITASFRTACMVICDFDEGARFHEHVEVPTVQRLVMRLPGELVVSTGPLRVQIFSRNVATGEIDALPDTPAVMTFERPVFPSMSLNPREARVGDVVQIDVAGLKPSSEIHTLLGATEITSAETTVGQNGQATILMQVPGTTATGPHLVTVGSDVHTADDILLVVERKPTTPPNADGRPRDIFELLVSYEDLLRRQAIQLDKFSDLIKRYQAGGK